MNPARIAMTAALSVATSLGVGCGDSESPGAMPPEPSAAPPPAEAPKAPAEPLKAPVAEPPKAPASDAPKAAESPAKVYTCAHCGGTFDKPGTCPTCGKELTVKSPAP